MNDAIWNTEEQRNAREGFRSNYARRPAYSTACQCCCPDMHAKGEKLAGWERGTVDGNTAMKCNNCGFVRVSKPRKAGTKGLTPSQVRKLNRIYWFFARDVHGPIRKFEVKPGHSGGVWVAVATGDHFLLERYAHIWVGPAGKVEVSSGRCGIGQSPESEESTRAHYEFMLR